MKQITKEQSGKLIAHWRLMPSDKDTAAVRDIVMNAVCECGMDATIDIIVAPWDIVSLGYGGIKAVVKIRNAYDAVRMVDGTLVRGMDKITIWFDKCAGLFDFESFKKRQKEESELFAKLPKEEAMAAIDNLPWDGVAVQFNGQTNGQERLYKKRTFTPFEGKGHCGYGAVWMDIADQVAAYIGGIARDLWYAGTVRNSKAA